MAIKQRTKPLQVRGSNLSDTFYQLDVLNGRSGHSSAFTRFDRTLAHHELGHLRPVTPEILQVNVGKLCNQSCAHCHVDAGPERSEVMTRETLEQCLDILRAHDIPTVDVTGGAPELNPHFRWFVEACRNLGRHVIDRCNLTIIVSNPKYRDLPQFLARNEVQIIASMPHYTRLRTDGQRGEGVFADSVRALELLNAQGYGMPDSDLILDFIYNPSGAFLPSSQTQLEEEFKHQFLRRHGIHFNNLYTITNLPISRFLDYLLESGNYTEYMQTLLDAFNPATVEGLMCRNTISVSWDGNLYDCDFNQMLDLKVDSSSQHVSDFDMDALMERRIVTDQHCYGCTAGSGSSCGGALV